MKSLYKCFTVLLIIAFALTACGGGGGNPPAPTATLPLEPTHTPQVETPPDTGGGLDQPIEDSADLVVCLAEEPNSLYPYASFLNDGAADVLEAIYDGPIDSVNYGYLPTIIEKVPNLADGDAYIVPFPVTPGDTVVNDAGEVVILEDGEIVRPSECRSSQCAIPYDSTDFEFAMDQMVVDFRLLPNLTWADGEPLTIEDSLYSFQLDSHPDSPTSKYLVDRTFSYLSLDENTIEWIGVPGYLEPNYQQTFWPPAPQHAWGQFSPGDLPNQPASSQTPIGWGPYTISEWNRGQNIILTKNPNYYRANEGLPHFDRLVFRFVGNEPNANLSSIISGECDLLDQSTDLTSDIQLLADLHTSGQIAAHFAPGRTWEQIAIGINPASYDDGIDAEDRPNYFGDVRTRQGIAHCIDRQRAIDIRFLGQTPTMNSYLPPNHYLYNAGTTNYPFDPIAGAVLLEQAGWTSSGGAVRVSQNVSGVPNGTPLSLNYYALVNDQPIIDIFIQSAAQCGIELKPFYFNSGDYILEGPDGVLFGRQFDLAQISWAADTIPNCERLQSSLVPGAPAATRADIEWIASNSSSEDDLSLKAFALDWFGDNISGYFNSTFDALCLAASSALVGEPNFNQPHQQLQIIFGNELPVIPLFPNLMAAASRSDLCGFVLDPTAQSEFWAIEEYGLFGMCP